MFARKQVSVLLMITIVLGIALTPGSDNVTRAARTQEDYPVTYGAKSRSGFNIDGNTIVWSEMSGLMNDNVYKYDITTKTLTQLTTVGGSSPDVHGSVIVWLDDRHGNREVYMYDTSTTQEVRITDTSDVTEMSPVTDGKYVVYKPTNKSIAVYSISDGKVKVIADGENNLSRAAIDNGKIVWIENAFEGATLWLYDIKADQKTSVTEGASGQFEGNPDISGDTVVWTNSSKGSFHIYIHDLASGTEGSIAESISNNQRDPAVYGDKVVWNDEYKAVYMYDLSTQGPAEQVSQNEGIVATPKIYGDIVIWKLGLNLFANADIGPSLLHIVNTTETAATMDEVLQYTDLALELNDYPDWLSVDRLAVAQSFIDGRPTGGFASLDDVQPAFDIAYEEREPIANINFAEDMDELKAALADGRLQQLDQSDFQDMTEAKQEAARYMVLLSRPDDGFADEAAIQTALDEAVERWARSDWHYVGKQGFALDFDDMAFHEGTPYVVHHWGGNYDGEVFQYDGTEWVRVGDSFAKSQQAALAIDSNGVVYVVYGNYDDTDRFFKLKVKRWDGATWSDVGNYDNGASLNQGDSTHIELVLDSEDTPYVAYRDSRRNMAIVVKKFNGTDWEEVGEGGAAGAMGGSAPDFAIGDDDTLYIAYSDNEKYKLAVKKWDGEEWVSIGSWVSEGGIGEVSLGVVGDTPYAAYTDSNNDGKIMVKKFDGTHWVQLGGTIGDNYSLDPSIAFDGDVPYVAYVDQTNDHRAVLRKFNGTDWVTVKRDQVTDSKAENTHLIIDDETVYLAYKIKSFEVPSLFNRTAVMSASLLPKGDVNGDGVVTPADALFITKVLQGKLTLTPKEKYILDMDGDDKITAADANLILQTYTGVK